MPSAECVRILRHVVFCLDCRPARIPAVREPRLIPSHFSNRLIGSNSAIGFRHFAPAVRQFRSAKKNLQFRTCRRAEHWCAPLGFRLQCSRSAFTATAMLVTPSRNSTRYGERGQCALAQHATSYALHRLYLPTHVVAPTHVAHQTDVRAPLTARPKAATNAAANLTACLRRRSIATDRPGASH